MQGLVRILAEWDVSRTFAMAGQRESAQVLWWVTRVATGVSHCNLPGQPEHGWHALTCPKQREKEQNPFILDTNRFRKSTASSQTFRNRGCVCWRNYSLWIICSANKLLSLHVSCSPLLPHTWVSVRPSSADFTRITPNLQQHGAEVASPVHGGWGEKPPDFSTSKEQEASAAALGLASRAITLQGCSSGAMPEPPGAVVCLRQFNSRKPKGAYAEGQEGMGERDAGPRSRWWCPEITIKLTLQAVCFFLWDENHPCSEFIPCGTPTTRMGLQGKLCKAALSQERVTRCHTMASQGRGRLCTLYAISPKLPSESLPEFWAWFCNPSPTLLAKISAEQTCSDLGEIRPPQKRALPAIAWGTGRGQQMPSGLKGFNNSKVFDLAIIPLHSAT